MLSRGLQPVGARVPEEDACLFSHERRRVWAQEATLAKHDEAMRLSYAKQLHADTQHGRATNTRLDAAPPSLSRGVRARVCA